MSFVVYLFVLLIAAGSVLFGLDWTSAPMSPMPASKYELHAAKEPVKAPPTVTAATKPETKPVAAPVQTVSKPQSAQTTAQAPAPIMAPEPVAAATPPVPKCDLQACAAAYRSFTPEDCTYQPNNGPRRLCTKGTPPAAAALNATQTPSPPDARAQASCNVSACSQAYISFTASDCTYQPLGGPRRLCTK